MTSEPLSVDAAAFDGHRIQNLIKLISGAGGVLGKIGSIDFEKLQPIFDIISQFITIVGPFLPKNTVQALSTEVVAQALSAHKSEVEAMGFDFGSFVTFLTAAMPLVQRVLAKDLSAIVPLIQAIAAYAKTFATAA